MTDIFDIIHYLIGLLIVGLLVWSLIQIHNYFSKDNIPIEVLTNMTPLQGTPPPVGRP
jgi:hypothetical protein